MNADKFIEIFEDFINEYDREYDEKNMNFIMQPFPILPNLVTVNPETKEMEKIDTPEKFDYYKKIIINDIKERIFKDTDNIFEKILSVMIVHIHKPFHIPFLMRLQPYISKDDYSKLLAQVWTGTEFPHQNGVPFMIESFQNANILKLMNDDELKVYQELPELITIYRGLQTKDATILGLSWTTDKEKAIWFASRWKEEHPIILEAKIRKEDIFAYKTERGESEVIVNPEKLILNQEAKIIINSIYGANSK